MSAHWGKIVYWAATIFAGLILVLAAASYFANPNMPIIRLAPLLIAIAIWLIGWACRYRIC